MVDATVSSVARLSPGVWVDLTTGVVNGQPGNLLPEMQLQLVGALWARRDTVSTWEDLSRALYPGVALGSPRALASAKNRLKQLKHQVEVSLSAVSEGLVLIEAVRGQGLRLVSPPTRTALLGREEVVAAAIGHLRSSGAVALLGLPGVGVGSVLAEVMARASSLGRGVQVLRTDAASDPLSATVYLAVAPPGVPQVEVPPLRHELLAELVRVRATRLLRVAPQAETVEAIVRMADGFPGMAVRLVAALATEGEAALRRHSPAVLRAGVDPARRADWVALGAERQRLLSACALFVRHFSDAALDELLPGGAAFLPGLAAWVGGSPAARWVAPEVRLLSAEAGLAAALLPAYAGWVLRQAEVELLPVRLGSAAARGRLTASAADLEAVAAACMGELRARALLGLAEAELGSGSERSSFLSRARGSRARADGAGPAGARRRGGAGGAAHVGRGRWGGAGGGCPLASGTGGGEQGAAFGAVGAAGRGGRGPCQGAAACAGVGGSGDGGADPGQSSQPSAAPGGDRGGL